MKDYLKQFVSLRTSLLEEKATLEARLQQINAVLASDSAGTSTPAKAKRGGGKRAKNKISLKAAVTEVTKSKPLTKPEILTAIRKLGYKFSTDDPMNSLNTVLYSNKQFKNTDGKFSCAG